MTENEKIPLSDKVHYNWPKSSTHCIEYDMYVDRERMMSELLAHPKSVTRNKAINVLKEIIERYDNQ
jgi:hypothetical protein